MIPSVTLESGCAMGTPRTIPPIPAALTLREGAAVGCLTNVTIHPFVPQAGTIFNRFGSAAIIRLIASRDERTIRLLSAMVRNIPGAIQPTICSTQFAE
jgi:hypothetical protein